MVRHMPERVGGEGGGGVVKNEVEAQDKMSGKCNVFDTFFHGRVP